MGVTYNYGAGPTYTKIASQTLGSTTATLTFSNLPQNYTDLVVVLNATTNHSDNGARGFVQFNSETSVYSDTWIAGNGSSVSSSRDTSDTYLAFCVPGNSSTEFGTFILNIQNYSNSTTYKSVLSRSSSTSAAGMRAFVGMYRSTSPITTVTFRADSSYRAGSTFTLYGIKAALKPKATGGDITTDGTYFIHTFRTSGVFQPNQNVTADYLVVAGGGGGGRRRGGGGGAGGYRSFTSQSLTSGTAYTVTVGGGGTGGTVDTVAAGDGTDSVFSSNTASGGGGGSSNGSSFSGQQGKGRSGGSGGGGSGGGASGADTNSFGVGNTPSTSPSQGNNGGNGFGTTGDDGAGGGGGGAGAVGGSNSSGSTTAGNGGNGTASSISGSSVTYAGGGGGGSNGGTAGTGGSGGGGNGSSGSGVAGSSGSSNTGGGGGGGGGNINVAAGNGGSGGSGIVIIRYSA